MSNNPDINISQTHQIFSNLLATDLSKFNFSLCVAFFPKKSQLPQYYRVQINNDLCSHFRANAKDFCNEHKDQYKSGNLRLLPFDSGAKPDLYEIEFLHENSHPQLLATIQQLVKNANHPVELPLYRNSTEILKHLKFYVLVAESGNGEQILFFRRYSEKKQLGQASKFVALFNETQMSLIKGPIFLFDKKFDAIRYNGTFFIHQHFNFELIMRYDAPLAKQGSAILEAIKSSLPISNFDEFAADCTRDRNKLKKLINIAKRGHLNDISIEDIRHVLEKSPSFGIVINKDGTLQHNIKDKWELLKLLDDDYLTSEMTGNFYETTGKRSRAKK